MASAPIQPARSSDAAVKGLWSLSFIGLLLTQWLTAVNDNIFRWLVIGIGKQYVDQSQISLVLMAGTACFVLPYMFLAAPAGYCSDRYSKRTVIVVCKVAEIVVMCLGVGAILLGNIWVLFFVVLLMGAQSALFSPAKLGSIPEMLPAAKISAANGMMGLTTVIATVIGMALGNLLTDWTGFRGQERWYLSAVALVGIATVGWLLSLLIVKLPAADPARQFPWNAVTQTVTDLKSLFARRALFRVALGIVFFWSVGVLAQLNIDQFAFESGAQRQSHVIPLLLALVAGVGAGSVMAGIWSAGRVELGILPLGAGGVAISSLLLFTVQGAIVDPQSSFTPLYLTACLFLFFLGTSAGLFDIPLAAYMQHHSPRESRGSILAAANLLIFSGMLVMSVVFAVLRMPAADGEPLLSARQIFFLCGIFTIPVFIYIVWLIPQSSIRFMVWLASRTVYRIKVYGRENLPATGPALIVSNHVSWLDGVLFLLTSSRPVRLIADIGPLGRPWLLRLAKFWGVILIQPTRPKAMQAALDEARQALLNGELVCIFPEGGITRTNQLQAFKPGLMRILEGTQAPVVPAYLDELWGSIFSFEGGKFFWKWPRRWPFPISIFFGPPLAQPDDVHQVRCAVQDLGAKAVQQRASRMRHLPRAFVRVCKKRKRGIKVADSTGAQLSGAQLLARCLVLRQLLKRDVLSPDERHVGVLLPPSLGGVVANVALALDRRIAVNLNYSVSSDTLNYCIAECGIRHVLTSRKFMDKVNFQLNCELVYLEDFQHKPTWSDKLSAGLAAYVIPAAILERSLGLHKRSVDDVLTVIFTSGSTGRPKGVMLTYGNVASNVEAIEQVVQLNRDDVLVGILPFFHSFGYTVTLWTVMSIDVKGIYHFSPLDSKQIGKLTQKHGGTILLATPTFLRSYLKRCEKDEFKTLQVVVAGAEKLPKNLSQQFEEKFGVRPVEGYGATELSPLVSVNVPPSRSRSNLQRDAKEGSVGRPVPGVSVKVVSPDTGRELGANETGMLLVTGPNVMKGYLNHPEVTQEKVKDGWYVTGDLAVIDDEGFIHITGRESRFSKIGGEMVSHVAVEEALGKLIDKGDDDRPCVAVTSVSHPTKGERLVVVHTKLGRSPEELCKGLRDLGLTNINIPATECFIEVEEIPLLGSGKLDLKEVKRIAEERFSGH